MSPGWGVGPPGSYGSVVDSGTLNLSIASLKNSDSMKARNTDIYLIQGDSTVILKGMSSLTINLETLSMEYQTDLGFSVCDHLALSAPEFECNGVITDEWVDSPVASNFIAKSNDRATIGAALRRIRESRAPFTLICDFGCYEGVVFKDFVLEETSDSINSFNFNFTAKQIIRASIQILAVEFLYDEVNNVLVGTSVQNGNITEITLTAFEAVSEGDKSILDNLYDAWKGAF